jgi:hypothetical protein
MAEVLGYGLGAAANDGGGWQWRMTAAEDSSWGGNLVVEYKESAAGKATMAQIIFCWRNGKTALYVQQ